MLTTDIEQRLADWPIDLLGAASLSLILASVAIFAYTLQRSFVIVSGKNVATTTGKGAEVVTRSLGYWRWPVAGLFATTAFFAVGMILAWNQPFWPITPYHTWGILLLAYSCLLLPYPLCYCSAALT